MAKSRRNSGGCTRGRYKRKKMGKGYSTARKIRAVPRQKPAETEASDGGDATKAKA